MLLSAVSVLVVAQSSSEIPEGLMNNPVFVILFVDIKTRQPSRYQRLQCTSASAPFYT